MGSQEATWNHRCFLRTQAIMVFIHSYVWHMRPQEAPHSYSECLYGHPQARMATILAEGLDKFCFSVWDGGRNPSCTFFQKNKCRINVDILLGPTLTPGFQGHLLPTLLPVLKSACPTRHPAPRTALKQPNPERTKKRVGHRRLEVKWHTVEEPKVSSDSPVTTCPMCTCAQQLSI